MNCVSLLSTTKNVSLYL